MPDQPGFDSPTPGVGTPGTHGATAAQATSHQPLTAQPQPPVLSGVRQQAESVGEIVNAIKTDGTRMLNDNIALAKAEVQPMAKHGGIGAGMFGGAGYLALCGVAMLFFSLAFGFGEMWASFFSRLSWLAALALGFLTVGLLLFLIAGILAMLGKKEVGKIGKPEATIQEFKTSIAALGESVKRGQQAVKVNSMDRAGLRQDKIAVADQDKRAATLREQNPTLN